MKTQSLRPKPQGMALGAEEKIVDKPVISFGIDQAFLCLDLRGDGRIRRKAHDQEGFYDDNSALLVLLLLGLGPCPSAWSGYKRLQITASVPVVQTSDHRTRCRNVQLPVRF